MDIERTATFPAHYDSLAVIGDFVTQAAEVAGLSARDIYWVRMAVEEASANIVEHAYEGEDCGDIECTCIARSNELTVVLRDSGRPFDPASVPEPDLHSCLEDRKLGGLGVYFIHKLMDEVCLERTSDSRNVLTMVKRKETPLH